MKKKEILIIFVLAVLVTGVAAFLSQGGYDFYCGKDYFPEWVYGKSYGWPLPFLSLHEHCYPKGIIMNPYKYRFVVERFYIYFLFFDFLFWFLVIFGIWNGVKYIKRKKK